MQTIVLRYGGDSHAVQVHPDASLASVLNNPSTKAVLGYGDNVRALVHGIEQPLTARVGGIAEIMIETRANEKAS